MDSFFSIRGPNFLQLLSQILFFAFFLLTRLSSAISIEDQREDNRSIGEESDILKSCDFNTDLKTYNASDFLRCVADLAVRKSIPDVVKKAQFSSTEELDRLIETLQAKEESSYRFYSRQRPGPYGFYDQVSGAQPFRPERPTDPAEYPFGGGIYNPEGFQGYPAAYDPSGLENSALVEALTSISRYDDLKCVPRLLCEMLTGSKPGNGYYRASNLENFGKSTLIGLLTSYNFERASPILGFAKAALLGYTSKDDSSICYKEYQKCPRDSRSLVHYLNNHNGGFFRFFKKSRRSQNAEGSNRKAFTRKELAPPPGLSGPESDRTGTGELKFDTSEPSPRNDEKIITVNSRNDFSSKIVFPDENETNYRLQKSLESDQLPSTFFPTQISDEKFIQQSSFFPSQNDDEEKNDERISNIVIFENDNYNYEKDSDSRSDKQRSQRASDSKSSITFPENFQNKFYFDSGPLIRQFFSTMERRMSRNDRPSST